MERKKRIIFFSHAVTMAHFTRPLKWLQSLDTNEYEIYFATSSQYRTYLPTNVIFVPITGIDAKVFADLVGAAKPIYNESIFNYQIAEDLLILDSLQPDIVIADFRHSLSVSCRLRKIKYVNITNAYWSSKIEIDFPMPEAAIVRKLGLKLSKLLINPLLKLILKFNFFKMVFVLRRPLRQANLFFWDYRQLLTDGDVTAFCDTPGLVSLKKRRSNEIFVGPLLWSVPSALPEWWTKVDPKKKKIFLSLGSSGNIEILPLLLAALSKVSAEVIVASAGRGVALNSYSNIHVTDFLPLEQVCKVVDLVICNGGSPMSHFALKYGVPVLGIVGNNDQLLNMAHLEKNGCAKILRYWSLSESEVIQTVDEMLKNSSYKLKAKAVETEFSQFDFENLVRQIVEQDLERL